MIPPENLNLRDVKSVSFRMGDFLINPQHPGETKSFSLTETVCKRAKFESQKFE
jgi:hypothetical protein